MPGGKYRSKQIRRIEGRPNVAGEIRPSPQTNLEPPRHLKGEARRFYRKNAKILSSLGLFTELDVPALMVFSDCWAEFVKASKDARDSEKSLVLREKAEKECKSWTKEVLAYAKLFGMTPASREKVSIYYNDNHDRLL